MKSRHERAARKRPVNSSSHRERAARSKLLNEAVARWNRFYEENGSIADEYSPQLQQAR